MKDDVCATSFSNKTHNFSGETSYVQHLQLFSLEFIYSRNMKNKEKQPGETETVHETKIKLLQEQKK